MAYSHPSKALDRIRREILSDYLSTGESPEKRSWRKVVRMERWQGIPLGTLCRIATTNYIPEGDNIRRRLGLPVLRLVEVSPDKEESYRKGEVKARTQRSRAGTRKGKADYSDQTPVSIIWRESKSYEINYQIDDSGGPSLWLIGEPMRELIGVRIGGVLKTKPTKDMPPCIRRIFQNQ
jgi:hypothetical protein